MKFSKTLSFSLFLLFQLLNGQNYQELQKIQDEYKKVLEKQSLQKPKDISNAEKTILSTTLPDKLVYSRKDIESLLLNTEKLLEKLNFYEDSINKMPFIGYDFFTKRDSIPFWQNIPISKNYILGPGDEIVISLWGESNSFSSEIINRDGQIFIEKVGILNIGGKSILDAKNHIISKYSRIYSTLVGQKPRSFIDLTLGELKSVNIHFVGRVAYNTLTAMFAVSSAHVYFTYPFVLSWSMLEAMSLEALIVGSNTDPVTEVIKHGKNGLIVDFHDHSQLAKTVAEVLDNPSDYDSIRKSARETIVKNYDLTSICLPQHLKLIESLI